MCKIRQQAEESLEMSEQELLLHQRRVEILQTSAISVVLGKALSSWENIVDRSVLTIYTLVITTPIKN